MNSISKPKSKQTFEQNALDLSKEFEKGKKGEGKEKEGEKRGIGGGIGGRGGLSFQKRSKRL